MKRNFFLIVSTVVLMLVIMTISTSSNTSGTREKAVTLNGVWKLISYKYGTTESEFINVSESTPHIELITDSYFTWTIFDKNTKRVLSSAGGKCNFDGNLFNVSVDFGLGMDPYLGKQQTYKISFGGDIYFLSGFLTEGYKIEEIWQRVK